ncbi:MAG: hypothetical protein IPH50_09335 [Rhodanobacteraceae bacterium]|nr:hypothetical protein [Rhodanobacteraceae bacterium]
MRAADVVIDQPAPLTAAIAPRLISIGEYGRAYDEIRAVDLERPFRPAFCSTSSQQLTLKQHELALRFLDVAERAAARPFQPPTSAAMR